MKKLIKFVLEPINNDLTKKAELFYRLQAYLSGNQQVENIKVIDALINFDSCIVIVVDNIELKNEIAKLYSSSDFTEREYTKDTITCINAPIGKLESSIFIRYL